MVKIDVYLFYYFVKCKFILFLMNIRVRSLKEWYEFFFYFIEVRDCVDYVVWLISEDKNFYFVNGFCLLGYI